MVVRLGARWEPRLTPVPAGPTRPASDSYRESVIHTLTYVSTLLDSLSPAEIEELLATSRDRNAAQQVTGVLLVRDRHVMQILEGPDRSVRDLYRQIEGDSRHFDVTTVWTSTSAERRFPDWSMGFEDLDEVADDSAADDLALSAAVRQTPDPEQEVFIRQRTTLLRRALASGDRLIGALAIILHAHDTTSVLAGGRVVLQCRECRADGSGGPYPCSTAANALWALDAVR